MLRQLGLQDSIDHKVIHASDRKLSAEEKVKYFRMLDDDELKKLYMIYAPDFELFGYTFNIDDYR